MYDIPTRVGYWSLSGKSVLWKKTKHESIKYRILIYRLYTCYVYRQSPYILHIIILLCIAINYMLRRIYSPFLKGRKHISTYIHIRSSSHVDTECLISISKDIWYSSITELSLSINKRFFLTLINIEKNIGDQYRYLLFLDMMLNIRYNKYIIEFILDDKITGL